MFKRVLSVCLTLFLMNVFLYGDRLEEIKEKGFINAGVKYDFKPFGYLDEKGEVIGFDIDLLKYVADYMGLRINFVQVTSKTRIPMVEKGHIDIAAASMTHKISRDEKIDFSISYFFDGQSFLMNKKLKVREPKDLAGKKVGAIQGATSGENLKTKVPKARIVYFQEYPQALEALKRGKIDAVTTDLVWCNAQAADSNGKLKVAGGTISVEPYGMGIMENESNLRDEVNFAIQSAVKDGTYKKLYMKWFKKEPEVLPEVWP